MDRATVFSNIPKSLRNTLIAEHSEIIENFSESRWAPSELSGGKFCEIVYSIIEGYRCREFPNKPSKPANFVGACRKLEEAKELPQSFQILIPRILPALYEIRNNRRVGHIVGDVDPNHMNATLVVSICNWVMAELVRVFHKISTEEAQKFVDDLVEREIPLVWQGSEVCRVLDPTFSLRDQILILCTSTTSDNTVNDLMAWCDYKNRKYFVQLLRKLHLNP